MLARINGQPQNTQNINKDISEELKAENYISNEFQQQVDGTVNPSNEANQDLARKNFIEDGMRENDHDSDREDEKENLLDIDPRRKRNRIIEDDDPSDEDDESQSGDSESVSEDHESESGDEEEKEEEEDAVSKILNTAFYGNLPGLNEDEGKKSGKKSAKKSDVKAGKKSGKKKKEEDLTQLDKSLEPVQELGIAVEKLAPRVRQTGLKKALSVLSYYSGKFFGKIFGSLATFLNTITWGVFTKTNPWRGLGRRIKGQDFSQDQKSRRNIPGWGGAQFEDRKENNNEVEADFRRVPEIWSYPIAQEADVTEGEGDHAEKKARPPIITVYIQQSSSRYTMNKKGGTGHTGIGIEYSRKSLKTGRRERYNLRYGFGLGGGMGEGSGVNVVTGYNNATVPGALGNEKNKDYTISRSFTATPKQVNDVLRASETYADRGGYNAYERNCTTFAKEMIVDVANIKGAAPIFEKDEVYTHPITDAKMLGGALLSPYFRTEMENKFAKMNEKDDMTYQGFGNKLASREDYERYNRSISFISRRKEQAYSPNGSAENMRRSEGGRSGKIGRFASVKEMDEWKDRASNEHILHHLPELARDLRSELLVITPQSKLTNGAMSDGFKQVMDSLYRENIENAMNEMPQDQDGLNKAKPSDLIRWRTIFTDMIDNLNTLLFKYYHNDKRVQKPVLEMINLANHAILNIDDAYEAAAKKENETSEKDVENIVTGFTGNGYEISYKDSGGKNFKVVMTPSQYESYLQIYKTPEKAIKNYAKYTELLQSYKRNEFGKDDAQYRELMKHNRIEGLAQDFEKAHTYMFDKAKYSQQDVDYAFALEKKERQGNVSSLMLEKRKRDEDLTMNRMKYANDSAANVYQMLIMKSIFGDMMTRVNDYVGKRGKKIELKDLILWFANDMRAKISENKEDMKMVIRGIKNSTDEPDADNLSKDVTDVLIKWLYQILHGSTPYYNKIVSTLMSPRSPLMKDVNNLVGQVMRESDERH